MSPDNPLNELKEIIKSKSIGIRTLRATIRSTMRSGEYAGSLQCKLYFDEKPYVRACHIAYCEIRGRDRCKIETPAEDNPPKEALVTQIKEQYLELLRAWVQKRENNHTKAPA